ncbi:MAG: DUF2149 domain-containing protein [Desulfurispora sp.]|uniref:DUF2149 domain-containing protein n=1 Tax=Desulfurispora sp. TaxID=3014275 RepID=UPI00404AD316
MLRPKSKSWQQAEEEFNPLSSLANLADVMFVFSVGLIVALVSVWQIQPLSQSGTAPRVRVIDATRGQEIKDLPGWQSQGGSGYQEMGTVYKDPRTGKLILIQSESP